MFICQNSEGVHPYLLKCWRGACSFVRMLKGYMVRKRLGTPALDHNFWTRNPSRSSKVSKESGCSLVSHKNFSEILPSNGLGPGPGEVGQGGLKVLHLWCHSQKICNPQPKKIFLSTDYKTCWGFWAFDWACSGYQTGEIPTQSHCKPGVYARTTWINPDAKVLRSSCRKQSFSAFSPSNLQ